MSFFNESDVYKAKSNIEKSFDELANRKPEFGIDTKEKDGRFFVFDREVSEKEYNEFMDQYKQIMDHQINEHKTNL